MLKLNGKEVSFKLDTGAEVTAISEETYRQVYGKTLQRASKVLYGPACQCLRSGRRKHQGSERCPAINVICHKCQKKVTLKPTASPSHPLCQR